MKTTTLPTSNRLARYTVRILEPQTHYIEVEAVFDVDGASQLELFLPVWTPGSYLVREFSRHVVLNARKTRKNRWVVETEGRAEITVRYRVFCHEMSVRTNWVDGRFALLNGPATLVAVVGRTANLCRAEYVVPEGWTVYGCPDYPCGYDALMDAPVYAGRPSVYRFNIDGTPHTVVDEGDDGVWDGQRSAADIETIFRYHRRMWGSLPYPRYTVLNLLVETAGGLEHKNSMCVMASRFACRTRSAYLGWLQLICHEHFHAWNGKRLRPVELGPFDYENENYTRSLWVVEGITEYYGYLNVRRAGLATVDEYLTQLGNLIENLQKTPGRLQQPVELASYDAWIKLYRPDENSANSSISYYVKGAVIAWILDARLRRASNNIRTLDDVMRVAYERFSGERGFTKEEFLELAGIDLCRELETTDELEYAPALDWFGLRFKPVNGPRKARAPLGFDDELLAIDGFRMKPDRMEQYRPGEKVELLISRRDRIVSVNAILEEEPRKRFELEILAEATPQQRHNLKVWLETA